MVTLTDTGPQGRCKKGLPVFEPPVFFSTKPEPHPNPSLNADTRCYPLPLTMRQPHTVLSLCPCRVCVPTLTILYVCSAPLLGTRVRNRVPNAVCGDGPCMISACSQKAARPKPPVDSLTLPLARRVHPYPSPPQHPPNPTNPVNAVSLTFHVPRQPLLPCGADPPPCPRASCCVQCLPFDPDEGGAPGRAHDLH